MCVLCFCRDLLADGAGSRPDAGRISDPNAIKHDAGGGHTIVQVRWENLSDSRHSHCCLLPLQQLYGIAQLVHELLSLSVARDSLSPRWAGCCLLAVQGAMRVPVTDTESAAVLMARAAEARACEATAMNAVSSRSHCVFMLYIAASHAATNTHLTGSLCLVDLAGRWVLLAHLATKPIAACSCELQCASFGSSTQRKPAIGHLRSQVAL